jgi:hypothetical protein
MGHAARIRRRSVGRTEVEEMTEAVIRSITPNKGMGESNEVKIQVLPNGQYIASIPRAIAQMYGLKKGDILVYTMDEGRIILTKKQTKQ